MRGVFENLAWRPYWVHQAGEYLVGLVLTAAGMQSPSPTVPTIAGGLILVNTGLSGPPLGAFRIASRALHRRLDVVVLVSVALLAVQPFWNVAAVSRLVMGMVAAILALLWIGTSFDPPPARRPTSVDHSEDLGRMAGRFVAKSARAARNRRQ